MKINNLKLLTLNVTENCNASCRYCHWWKKKKDHPPLNELITAIDEAMGVGLKGVRISGGEPLLRPDLTELITYIKYNGLVSMVCTSANSDIEQLTNLVESGLDIISISIDTLDTVSFKKLRGYSISQVKKNLDTLANIRPRGFEIILSIVLTRMSLSGVPALLEYARQLDVLINITPYQSGASCNSSESLGLHCFEDDKDQLDYLMDLISSSAKSGLRILNSDNYLYQSIDYMINRQVPSYHKCRTGFSSAIRMANGEVKLCHSLDPLPAGNLSSIWCSPEADRLREKMMRLDCPVCWLSCHADQRRAVVHRYGRPEIWEAI